MTPMTAPATMMTPHAMTQPIMPSMALVPLAQATHTAARTGLWSDPATWQGAQVPGEGARVVIPKDAAVTVDAVLAPEIKTLRVDGMLDFRTDIDTELKVDTLVTSQSGTLRIGSADLPIDAGVSARITFADDGAIDRNWDPDLISRGALLHGRTEIHGVEKMAFTTVADFPQAGDTVIALSEAPLGWAVGDDIVLAGTDTADPLSDESVTITAIDGSSVMIDRPLARDHEPPRADLDVHVANLTRNVQFASENSGALHRGHVMIMHTNDADLNYLAFDDLGRSNKIAGLNDWQIASSDVEGQLGAAEVEDLGGSNVRGRYSLHFHRGGTDGDAARVNGAVVTDDPGWAYVNHSSNVDFTNNVSHNIGGAAYNTEAGDEAGSFIGNIALRTYNPNAVLNPVGGELDEAREPDARVATQDFGWQGDGFWLHGSGVTLEDNVVAGASGHGYIYWQLGLVEKGMGEKLVDVANLPNGDLIGPDGTLVRTKQVPVPSFDGNQAYGAPKGLDVRYLHTDHRDAGDREAVANGDLAAVPRAYESQLSSTFSDFTAWNTDLAGIIAPYSSRLHFSGLDLLGTGAEGSYGVALDHFANQHSLNLTDSRIIGFDVGVAAPRQGQGLIETVSLANRTDILISAPDVDPRDLTIRDFSFEPLEGVLAGQEAVRQNFLLAPFRDADFDAQNAGEVGFDADEDSEGLGAVPLPHDVHNGGVAGDRGTPSGLAGFETPLYSPFLLPDRITVENASGDSVGLYFAEQAGDYVPIQRGSELAGLLPDGVAGLSNAEMQARFGVSWGDALIPDGAMRTDSVSGGIVGAPAPAFYAFPPALDPRFVIYDEFGINPATGTPVDDSDDEDKAGRDDGEQGPLTVAFVGDSITEGAPDASFVDTIAEQAGDAAEVMNFGVGGAGLTEASGDLQYAGLAAHAALLNSDADIVWVMIGGNDLAGGARVGAYEDRLAALVGSIADMPSDPEIVIAAQPPFFEAPAEEVAPIYADGAEAHAAFRDDWLPAMQRVADDANAIFIDINARVEDYPDNYPDLVHPDGAGALSLAELIAPELSAVADARLDGAALRNEADGLHDAEIAFCGMLEALGAAIGGFAESTGIPFASGLAEIIGGLCAGEDMAGAGVGTGVGIVGTQGADGGDAAAMVAAG